MFLFFVVFFLIVGFAIIFMYGVIADLTQEKYNTIIENKPDSILKKIWNKYDEITSTLFFLNAFCLFLSFSLSGTFIKEYNIEVILLIIVSIIVAIFIDIFFFSLGKRFASKPIEGLAKCIYYITFVLLYFMGHLNNLFVKVSGKDNDDITMADITDLVEEAHEDGELETGEYRLLKNIMNFNDVLVSVVMTPRVVMFSCDANTTVAEAIKIPEMQMYSRVPIWEGDSIDDEVLGYVTTKEVFSAALNSKLDAKLKDFARPINFIPENAELGKTLDNFLANMSHLMLVVDEYGGIEGILTLEDILEAMLGKEIVDEADKIVDLRAFARRKRKQRIDNIDNNVDSDIK